MFRSNTTTRIIKQQYEKFAGNNIKSYLRSLFKYKYIQNYMECETHRELVLTSLKGENHSERRKS